jgi:hypothetical protein
VTPSVSIAIFANGLALKAVTLIELMQRALLRQSSLNAVKRLYASARISRTSGYRHFPNPEESGRTKEKSERLSSSDLTFTFEFPTLIHRPHPSRLGFQRRQPTATVANRLRRVANYGDLAGAAAALVARRAIEARSILLDYASAVGRMADVVAKEDKRVQGRRLDGLDQNGSRAAVMHS